MQNIIIIDLIWYTEYMRLHRVKKGSNSSIDVL